MDEVECNLESFGLNEVEIAFAVNLAQPLKEGDVDQFLEIYDSIPASVESERVGLIKDMARQLAALPRISKQYELYRSRKFLSSDSFSTVNVGGKVFKEKVDSQINTCDEKLKPQNNTVLKCSGDKEKPLTVLNDTNHGGRKRRKGKKARSDNIDSSNLSSVLDTLKSGKEAWSDYNNRKPGEDFQDKRENKNCESVDKSPCESDYYSAEGGCLPSPAVVESPPFGFPLSPDKLFESAVGLLAKHEGAKQFDSTSVTLASQSLISPHSSTDSSQNSAASNPNLSSSNNKNVENLKKFNPVEDIEIDEKLNKNTLKQQHEQQEKYLKKEFIEDIENTGQPGSEHELIRNDISSLILEEEGWQSQTRRHNKKKKKENISKFKPNRDKHSHHSDKLQKKDPNYNRQGQRGNKLGNNDNYKRKFENKHFQDNRSPSDCKDYEEKCHRWINGESPNSVALTSCLEDSTTGSEISEEAKKSMPVDHQDSKPKLLSYRDALLKSKSKEDLHYSSDSGVDASSVSSSCDSVIPQSELSVFPQQDAAIISHCKKVPTVSVLSAETGARRKSDTGGYNHAEVVRYLWESWMVVQEKCKQGLVVRYDDRRVEQVPLSCPRNQVKTRSPGWGQRHRKGKVY